MAMTIFQIAQQDAESKAQDFRNFLNRMIEENKKEADLAWIELSNTLIKYERGEIKVTPSVYHRLCTCLNKAFPILTDSLWDIYANARKELEDQIESAYAGSGY